MPHCIQVIIGPERDLSALSADWIYPRARVLRLKEGFGLIPLTPQLLEDMNEVADVGDTPAHAEFEVLSKSVEAILKEHSISNFIGYIETQYHGGQGSQSAIAYAMGGIIKGPLTTKTLWDDEQLSFVTIPENKRAINTILYELGLERRTNMDGFDQLRLGHYRTNEVILKALK